MERQTKQCQNCQKEFIIEPEDFAFYEKIKVPAPTFCPECRLVRRMLWRNERSLSKRKCGLCGKNIISIYPQDAVFPVYCTECWWGDKWDAAAYQKDYDFNKPFFNQYQNLFSSVPRVSAFIRNGQNTDFANFIGESKNVYLSYSVIEGSEEVYYSKNIDKSLLIFDCFGMLESQKCFQNISSGRNYNCFYTDYTRECLDSYFLYDCVNCRNCFMSANLRNKEYYFKNKPCAKKDYFKLLKEIDLGDYKTENGLKEEFLLMKEKSLHRYANIIKSTNTTGDDIFNSKNAKMAFWSYTLEDIKYVFRAHKMKDSMDTTHTVGSELFYEFIGGGAESGFLIKFSTNGNPDLQDISYSDFCGSSSHLFGCVGLRNKEYCILNKQYTKQEYEALVPKIIRHMNSMPYVDKKGRVYKYGEFFPPELSPFCYNETIAQEYFPLTKEQAIEQGYRWKEPEERNLKLDFKPQDLPDHIKDVKDDIIGKVIECANAKSSQGMDPGKTYRGLTSGEFSNCTTAFRIISQELAFYRRMNLPLPRLCPNCRHYERLKQRNPSQIVAQKVYVQWQNLGNCQR